MVRFTINGKEMEAEEGTTVLEAAAKANVKIPTLCYHKDLTPYGACRVCLVEVVKRGWASLQPACLYEVFDGLAVNTDSECVRKTRKIMFELLLARCPDAPKIRDLAAEYGVTATRFKLENRENCILCGLCVRACAEISQRHAISFSGRGGRRRKIQTPFDELSDICVGCGACACLCPTGVIKIVEAE